MKSDGQQIRVLILGDSLAFARPTQGQLFDDIWPVLLKKKFPQIDFWQRCRAASTTKEVLAEFHNFSESITAFEYVIIQCGITDCTPRPYPYFLHPLLLSIGGKAFIKKINSLYPTLLNFYARPWIDGKQFSENLAEIIKTCFQVNPSIKIRLVTIGEPCHSLIHKVPGVRQRQQEYNELLVSLAQQWKTVGSIVCINPYQTFSPEDLFIADGHHLTKAGHLAVANALSVSFTDPKDQI